MLHVDQHGEKLLALLRLLMELMERVRVVEALSNVPQMYCLAVVEVVRRKMFMRHYREVSAPNTVCYLASDSASSRFHCYCLVFPHVLAPTSDPVFKPRREQATLHSKTWLLNGDTGVKTPFKVVSSLGMVPKHLHKYFFSLDTTI